MSILDIGNVIKQKKKEKAVFIPIEELMPNPMQPRRTFDIDELQSLSNSIKTYGLIQPIAVKRIESLPFPMPKSTAKYEIIAGERRWRASKMAGLKTIPCIIFEADRQDSAMMALVENLQRSDLSYFEEAMAMQTLLLMTNRSQSELAKALSISQPTLSNKLRLLKLSERERLMAMENGFSERHCRALVRLETERERRPIMLAIIKDKLSAPETERLIDAYFSETPVEIKTEKKKPIKRKKPSIKGFLSDIKFLFNTLDKSVKLLENSGYNAVWEKKENDDGLEIVIKVGR